MNAPAVTLENSPHPHRPGALPSAILAGCAAGLLYVKLLVPSGTMGWDGLADVLGGLMVGAACGLLLAVLLVLLTSVRTQAVCAAALAVLALGVGAGLVLTAPERVDTPPVERRQAFQPLLRIRARVSLSAERLAAIPPDQRPLPFTEIDIFSAKPELVATRWNEPDDGCRATPSTEDLRTLVPLARAALPEAGPFCRSPQPDDPSLGFNWRVGEERGALGLDAACLEDKPALRALIEGVEELYGRVCGGVAAEG